MEQDENVCDYCECNTCENIMYDIDACTIRCILCISNSYKHISCPDYTPIDDYFDPKSLLG